MIQIQTTGEHPPRRATDGSAAFDLFSQGAIQILPGETVLARVGFRMALPEDRCALILPRSGLALKSGLTLANSPGLIDSDYRGEVMVALWYRLTDADPITLKENTAIAQMLIQPVVHDEWKEVPHLPPTARGEGGFGSTSSNL